MPSSLTIGHRIFLTASRLPLSVLCRRYTGIHADVSSIPRIERLPADQFVRDFLAPSVPVVSSHDEARKLACTKWSLAFLREALRGKIHMARSDSPAFRTRRVQFEFVDIREALDQMLGQPDAHGYCYAKNLRMSESAFAPLRDDVPPPPLYPLRDDETDPRLWMGSKGAITPLHYDLFPNFLVQLTGSKRVTLAAPSATDRVYPEPPWRSAYWYSAVGDVETADRDEFPRLNHAGLLHTDLGPGDVLFIPTGWWHNVRVLQAGISANYFFTPRDHPSPTVPQAPLAWFGDKLEQVQIALAVRAGGVGRHAAPFQVYLNRFNPEQLQAMFERFRRSRNPLIKWAIAPWPDLQSMPFYPDWKAEYLARHDQSG